MQVESLNVERRPSYDSEYPHQLVGTVSMKSVTGSQSIRLSNAALSKIFNVITQEVAATAKANADMTTRAMADATHEPLLADASKVEVLA